MVESIRGYAEGYYYSFYYRFLKPVSNSSVQIMAQLGVLLMPFTHFQEQNKELSEV